MKIIVTGNMGWIGSHLCPELKRRGHEVIGVDRRPGSDFKIDLAKANFNYILSAVKPEIVIHLAAQPGRVFGQRSPSETIRNNVTATYGVAEACGYHGVRLVYTSTSEVYGPSRTTERMDETCRTRPINLYGMTKLWGEDIALRYAPDELLILRPTMPYGPGMEVGDGRAALPTFIYDVMLNRPIQVHRGAQRSWCYIDDFIDAFMLILEKGRGIYNIGRDDDLRSMDDIARMACEIAGRSTDLIKHDDHDDTITLVKNLSTKKLYRLGFEPKIDIRDGMRNVYEWLLTATA